MVVMPQSGGDPLEAMHDLKAALKQAAEVVGRFSPEAILAKVYASETEGEPFLLPVPDAEH